MSRDFFAMSLANAECPMVKIQADTTSYCIYRVLRTRLLRNNIPATIAHVLVLRVPCFRAFIDTVLFNSHRLFASDVIIQYHRGCRLQSLTKLLLRRKFKSKIFHDRSVNRHERRVYARPRIHKGESKINSVFPRGDSFIYLFVRQPRS